LSTKTHYTVNTVVTFSKYKKLKMASDKRSKYPIILILFNIMASANNLTFKKLKLKSSHVDIN
jgi:hypothetical protein